jgi:hypothetical protein
VLVRTHEHRTIATDPTGIAPNPADVVEVAIGDQYA